MKYVIYKKTVLEATLDSSELTMLNKGGKHTIKINPQYLIHDDKPTQEEMNEDYPQIFHSTEITFQLERNQQGMFDFTFGEAQKHKERCGRGNEDK